MAPSILLALPAEVRQQILSEALNISSPILVFDEDIKIITPLNGICNLLLADIDELLNSWIPEPASTKVVVKSREGLQKLAELHRRCTKRAAAQGLPWPGLGKIQIPCIHNEFSRQGSLKTVSAIHRVKLTELEKFDMTLLPKTVKKILIDLTMPSEPLKALEELFPLNTVQFAAPPPRALEDFWVKLIMKLRERIETLARNLITAGRGEKRVHQAITVGTTEVALKSMGFFPQSQVKAMLHSTQPIWRTYCLQWHSAASMSFFESYFPGLRSSRDHWRGMLAKMQRDRERSLRVLHREVKKEQQAKEYEKKKAKEYEEKKAKEYEEKKAGRK